MINNLKWAFIAITIFFFPALVFGDDFGNALEFDGSNDYVDCGQSDEANLTGSLTIEAWIKPYTKNSNLTIVANSSAGLNNSGYALHVNTWNNTDGKIGFETNNGDPIVTEDSVVEFDKWQHLAVTASGVTATVYINGEAKKVIGSVNLTSTTNNLIIGAMPGPSYYYKGQIEELRIWSVIRSQEEINDNMCQTLNGNESGLVAYYQFDETGSSTNLPDMSVNNNNGTLKNMDSILWQSSNIEEEDVCIPDLPIVSTMDVIYIGSIAAKAIGNISNLSKSNPIQHGFCWDTDTNPTIADNKSEEGPVSAIGTFSTYITTLSPSTKYYIRAYATNNTGTSYASEITFTTNELKKVSVPSLTKCGVVLLTIILMSIGILYHRRLSICINE